MNNYKESFKNITSKLLFALICGGSLVHYSEATSQNSSDVERDLRPLGTILLYFLSEDSPPQRDDFYTAEINSPLEVLVGQGLFNNDEFDTQSDFDFEIIENVINGILTVSEGDGAFNYLPNPNFIGTDTFIYSVNQVNRPTFEAKVTINVIDNREGSAPSITVFASDVTEESVSVGDVVATFSSSDPDGDSLTHSVLNDPNGFFSISGTDVVLTQSGVDAINNDALDLTSLTVEIQADDGTFQSSDSDSVSITRVNGNAPVIDVTASNVTEESVSVGDVVATFSSSDPDGDSLTHSVLNDPNGFFSISGTDVVLTQSGVDAINNDALDLSSLTVEIQADDGTFQSSGSDFVSITRVNDNAPVISVTASSVTEESVSVGDVVATFSSSDPDGDSLTHSVLNDPNGFFSISGTDVVLTQSGVDAINNDALDLSSLTVEIQADDGTFQSSDSDFVSITRV